MPDSPAFPDAVTWTFRNARTKETRTYEQTELSLEGEARVLGVGRSIVAQMTERAVPWQRLRAMFGDGAELDWPLLLDALSMAVEVAPSAVSEVVALFMGIYPVNEDGTRNPDFAEEVRFLRAALNTTKVLDVLQVAATQNDYRRLIAPFSETLTSAARRGMEMAAETGSVPSLSALPEPVLESPATPSAGTPTGKSKRTVT